MVYVTITVQRTRKPARECWDCHRRHGRHTGRCRAGALKRTVTIPLTVYGVKAHWAGWKRFGWRVLAAERSDGRPVPTWVASLITRRSA